MALKPEDQAREQIDSMLEQSGWHVCDIKDANIHAYAGVVIRNFPLTSGHGEADYIFYVDGKAAGVIEAKKWQGRLTRILNVPNVFASRFSKKPFWEACSARGIET